MHKVFEQGGGGVLIIGWRKPGNIARCKPIECSTVCVGRSGAEVAQEELDALRGELESIGFGKRAIDHAFKKAETVDA